VGVCARGPALSADAAASSLPLWCRSFALLLLLWTGERFGLENYQAFFSDPISVRNLVFTLLSPSTLGLLFVICFPIALFSALLKALDDVVVQGWHSFRCSFRAASSWPTR